MLPMIIRTWKRDRSTNLMSPIKAAANLVRNNAACAADGVQLVKSGLLGGRIYETERASFSREGVRLQEE